VLLRYFLGACSHDADSFRGKGNALHVDDGALAGLVKDADEVGILAVAGK
jgi:hypothetical protein